MTKQTKLVAGAVLLACTVYLTSNLVFKTAGNNSNNERPEGGSSQTIEDLRETGVSSPPLEEGDVNVQVLLHSQEYSYNEPISIRAAIQNNAEEAKTFAFNTTCHDGTLIIDGETVAVIKACGQAESTLILEPGEAIGFTYDYSLVEDGSLVDNQLALEPGIHSVEYEWQGVRSAPLTFSVDAPS